MSERRSFQWLIMGLLFVAALIPRALELDRFITSDEYDSIYVAGSEVALAFLRGDLRETYWHFYPGVVISWFNILGISGKYLLEQVAGQNVPAYQAFVRSDVLTLLAAARWPYVLLSSLFVPLVYWLGRRLFSGPVAFLGALFIAFDPFFMAHSRVIHGDAPDAVFMTLSLLCFLIFAQETRPNKQNPSSFSLLPSPFFIASALFGGLAALTKAPGQFMAIVVVGLTLLFGLLDWGRQPAAQRRVGPVLRYWGSVVGGWGLISLVVFVLLWPSMWVDPVGTLRQMLAETFGKVEAGHLVYFLGQPTLDPGPWFYPYVVPFRLTPVTSLGLGFSLIYLVFVLRGSAKGQRGSITAPLLLWVFVVSLLLFGNLSPKKQDRYLLPLFPALDLLAAVGWVGLVTFGAARWFRGKKSTNGADLSPPRRALTSFLMTLIFLVHLWPTFSHYPYYLAYFNPLMGGLPQAAETTLVGWGEGMEQVAAYLNTKPDAADLYVASTPAQTMLPYFVGDGDNFYTNDIAFRADYVVLYLAQIQRRAPSPEIVDYFLAQTPEKVITIQGVPYAYIYPHRKRILTEMPAQAVPVNIGLENVIRLAGYWITDELALADQRPASRVSEVATRPELTLYWHALAPIDQNYTISLRAFDSTGTLLAQQDQWPVQGLLPTSQWRQGDYVVDRHRLPVATTDRVELVVYNAESGQTLGPPIALDLSR